LHDRQSRFKQALRGSRITLSLPDVGELDDIAYIQPIYLFPGV
jgi:hypothetical protein